MVVSTTSHREMRDRLLDFGLSSDHFRPAGDFYSGRIGWSGPGSLIEALGRPERKEDEVFWGIVFQEIGYTVWVHTKGGDIMPGLYDLYTQQVWGREEMIEEVPVQIFTRTECLPDWLMERILLQGGL